MGWSNPPSKQAYNPYDVPKCEAESCEGLAPPPNVNPKTGQTKKTTNKEIEEWRANRSDLAAQWETADATRVAFRSAVLGIWLLFWTLLETRNASSYAGKALLATRQATELVRQEQRPWIFIDRKVSCEFLLSSNSIRVSWRHTAQNIGKSPAYSVCFSQTVVRTEHGFIARDEITKAKEKLIGKVSDGIGSIVIPNQPNMDFGTRSSTSSHLKHIRGKGDKFHLIAGVAYTDRQRTEIFYDIQAYTITEITHIGPSGHKLIHNQHMREVN